MTFGVNHKLLLIGSLVSAVYFGLLFSNLLQNINSVFVGAVIEFFTFPMILLQVTTIVYTLSMVFIKRSKTSFEIIVPLVISVTLVLCMFLVK